MLEVLQNRRDISLQQPVHRLEIKRPSNRQSEILSPVRVHSSERSIFVKRRHAAVRQNKKNREKSLSEMQRNGARIIRRLRKNTNQEEIPADIFGATMGTNGEAIHEFERTRKPLGFQSLYLTAKSYFHNEGEELSDDMRELRRITNHAEENRLISVLTQDGMSIGRAITLLRLRELEPSTEFEKNVGFTKFNLAKYETDRKKPTPFVINRIIESVGLDLDSMPAQLIRLINAKVEPMSLDELQTCSFGDLVRYLYGLRGATRADVANVLDAPPSTVSRFEKKPNTFPPERFDNFLNEFNFWLEISPDSSLSQILASKANNSEVPIPEEILVNALTQQYLFWEHVQAPEPHPLNEGDTKLLTELREKESLAEMVQIISEKEEQDIRQIASNLKMPEATIRGVITERNVPKDTTLVRILMGFGYDIYHPITQFLLKRLLQDRAYKSYEENIFGSSIEVAEELEMAAA